VDEREHPGESTLIQTLRRAHRTAQRENQQLRRKLADTEALYVDLEADKRALQRIVDELLARLANNNHQPPESS
jgi:acyl-ACP thioesterase